MAIIDDVEVFIASSAKTNTKNLERLNIFECLAHSIGDLTLANECRLLWGSDEIRFSESDRFFQIFGLNLQLWSIKKIHRHIRSSHIFGKTREPNLMIAVENSWDSSRESILISDNTFLVHDKNVLNYFECPHDECFFVGSQKEEFLKHIKRHDADRVKCSQIEYGPRVSSLELMKMKKMLEEDFRQDKGVFWDIESLLIPSNGQLTHVPTTIAAVTNFGSRREIFLYRDSMTPDALKRMIIDFVNFLDFSVAEFRKTFSENFWGNYHKVKDEIEKIAKKNSELSVHDRSAVHEIWSKYKDILTLKVFTFCGERYDVPCLKGPLFDEFLRRDKDFNATLRGVGILTFEYNGMVGRDVYNYCPPISLRKFSESFGIFDIGKDIWPYTFFKDIDVIKNTTTFPSISVFDSSDEDFYSEYLECCLILISRNETIDPLQWFGLPSDFDSESPDRSKILPISPKKYMKCKENFDSKIRTGEWTSMLDQLSYYNILDCKVLERTWAKYSELFFEKFNIDIFENLSLSHIAQTLLFKKYPENVQTMTSFSEKYTWLNKEIRQNLCGGLAAVFSRHAQTGWDENLDREAVTVPNGDPIRLIEQFDINSLYPTVMKLDLPVGSGILYRPDNLGIFKPEVMKKNDGRNVSKISLKWLDLEEVKLKRSFPNAFIQHGANGYEKQIGRYFLDGFSLVDGKKIGYDFLGCRFHSCNVCPTRNVQKNDEGMAEREAFLRNYLDEYHTMKECIFRRKLSREKPKFSSLQLSNNLNPEIIIKKLRNKEIFGIFKVDIICPDSAKRKFLELNFPPIFNHVEVTEDMIHPFFRHFAQKKYHFPLDPQLALVFNAKEIILSTPILLFYLENGLKITKIHYFVHYNADQCFKPFIDELVSMRIQATEDKNDEHQLLAKLMLNSSWGRLAMNLNNRRETKYIRSKDLSDNTDLHLESSIPLFTEYKIDILELKKKKRVINDRIPVHVALFILQNSKLHMMKFLDFLYNHLKFGSYRLLYMDTDSFTFSLSDSILNLIRPDAKQSFEKLKSEWFLTNNSAREKRFPGKMKSEFSTKNGVFYGCSPKCYIICDYDENEEKKAHKGVRRTQKMTSDAYRYAVYNADSRLTDFSQQFKFNKDTCKINTVNVNKQLINTFISKFCLQPNHITLKPLSLNGDLL